MVALAWQVKEKTAQKALLAQSFPRQQGSGSAVGAAFKPAPT
jgi:hypothetical protein